MRTSDGEDPAGVARGPQPGPTLAGAEAPPLPHDTGDGALIEPWWVARARRPAPVSLENPSGRGQCRSGRANAPHRARPPAWRLACRAAASRLASAAAWLAALDTWTAGAYCCWRACTWRRSNKTTCRWAALSQAAHAHAHAWACAWERAWARQRMCTNMRAHARALRSAARQMSSAPGELGAERPIH